MGNKSGSGAGLIFVALLLGASLSAASCTSSSGPSEAGSSLASPAGSTARVSREPGTAKITVTPTDALIDEPVAVKVTGLSPGAAVTVTAAAADTTGVKWSANAEVTADAEGVATLDEPSASGSSYTGVNPMGLFENMTPIGSGATFFLPDLNGYPVTLTASVGGKSVASAITHRLGNTSTGVTKTIETVAAQGIHGVLFMPRTSIVGKPAIMVFGGSEGGLGGEALASTLADHGYPTLALAYFKEPDLPPTLTDIPLEYFVKGLKLLAAQPGVDGHKVMVEGVSRGSEAALLLGAHFPSLVHGVVAGSPSVVVFGNFPSSGRAAWTLAGNPLAYASDLDFVSGDPEPTDAPAAVIPVEQIKGPILTICGAIDALWHSCGYSRAMAARLEAHHVAYPYTALEYADAGHFVGSPFVYSSETVTGDGGTGFGGTVNSNAMASAQAHQQLLSWLARQ